MTHMNFELHCKCGKVGGEVTSVAPNLSNHVVCYCIDCQAFAHALGRGHDMLDEHGGTRILQIYPSRVSFTKGHEHIRCLRLGTKAMNRFYAACCNTAIGNATAPKVPVVGIPTDCIPQLTEEVLPVRMRVFGRYGHGKLPEGTPDKFSFGETFWLLRLILRGSLAGAHKKSPYFDYDSGLPIVKPETLSEERRDAIYTAAKTAPRRI